MLKLTAAGHSHKAVAARLGVSVKSVETYKMRGMEKLGFQKPGRACPIRFLQRLARAVSELFYGHAEGGDYPNHSAKDGSSCASVPIRESENLVGVLAASRAGKRRLVAETITEMRLAANKQM